MYVYFANIMKKFVKTSCKLCRNVISGGNSTATNEIITEVLDILLPKLDAQEKNILVMCNDCSIKLFAAFNFKVTCLDIEDCLFPYVHSACGALIDLREVYLKEKGKEHLRNMFEDERICRLCMQVVICDFISIEDVDIDMLCRYIPQVNLSSTEQPIICTVCLQSLYTHTNFLNNICHMNEEMNDNCDNVIEGLSTIKHEEEVIKFEEDYIDAINNSILNCKKKQHAPKNKYYRLKYKDSIEEKINKCDVTDYESDRKKNIMRQRRQEQMQQCVLCDYKTCSKHNLARHRHRHKYISEKQIYQCDLCNYKTCRRSYFTQHQLKHEKNILEKQVCLRDCKTNLKDNLTHQLRDKQMYKCDSCDYKTHRKKHLKNHQLRHRSIPEEEKYKCDLCDFKTIHKSSLAIHQLRHKNIPDEQMYKCDLCDFKTIHKSSLAIHQLRHNNIPEEQMYKCYSCDYKSVYKNCLKRHQVKHKVIPEEQLHTCDWCDYKTAKMKYFKWHQLKHKGADEKLIYECDKCDFHTISMKYFTRHHLTHKGLPEDKKYKCDLCNYKTIYKTNLNKHMLKHKSSKEEQMYKCDSCNFKSRYKYNVRRHQIKHKDIPRE